MGRYFYVAISESGRRVEGDLEAASRPEALQQLFRRRLQPVSVTEGEGKAAGKKPSGGARAEAGATAKPAAELMPQRLSQQQVILFTEEVADLLEAGLPLESALKVIESRKEVSGLKTTAAIIRQRLRDGEALSNAMRAASPSFGELFCNLVAAGETSGALTEILKRQARYLTTMLDLRNQVLSTLIYPAFLAASGIGLMALFVTVLLPQLVVLFEKTDRALPFATRMLIGISDFMSAWWWALLGGVFLGGLGIAAALRTPAGKGWWDRAQLRIPLIGAVFEARFLAQFAQTLSNLTANGLTLLDGLRLMEKATGNDFIRRAIHDIADLVAEGISFAGAMRRTGGFPDLFVDLVSVGEQTGGLPASLERAARRYEKEMNARIKTVTALVQPVIIILIAGVILLLVWAIVTSIFQVTSSLRMRGGA